MIGTERRVDLLDLDDAVRDFVRSCEVSGQRTIFERDGRPVAVLLAYDEVTALRETLAISNDAALREKIAAADALVARGAMLLPEDLFDVE